MLTVQQQALKAATRRLVQAVGGQEAATGFCRVARHQTLSDYGNPCADAAQRFAPVDVIADLEAVTHGTPGHPAVTRQLARMAGYELVPLAPAQGGAVDFAGHLARVIRESADVTSALSLHLSESALTGVRVDKAAALRREVAEAIQALVELDAALEGAGE